MEPECRIERERKKKERERETKNTASSEREVRKPLVRKREKVQGNRQSGGEEGEE